MADIDQKKLDAIAKKVRAQLEAALKLAREAGIANPALYIESEGQIYIMDRDHPMFDSQSHQRQKSVVAQFGGALPRFVSLGAW